MQPGSSETLIASKVYGVIFLKRAVFVGLFSSGHEIKEEIRIC
jgi:hypothetical protein